MVTAIYFSVHHSIFLASTVVTITHLKIRGRKISISALLDKKTYIYDVIFCSTQIKNEGIGFIGNNLYMHPQEEYGNILFTPSVIII